MKANSICQLAQDGLHGELNQQNTEDKKLYVSMNSVFCVETSNNAIKGIMDTYETQKDVEMPINDMKWDSKVKVTAEYLKVLLEFLKKNKDIETVTIHAKTDYPLCVALDGFKTRMIIAPRVED